MPREGKIWLANLNPSSSRRLVFGVKSRPLFAMRNLVIESIG
jgi:hypothetical protein